ncbi:type II toxin-antitoxin system VapB family antitoxin [Roseateles amylovorans]|uniref:Type II toxin-antitoxin system VapB family antitoxin n=1 Tax=Roseateles amylovorans TaxID=2978473 RepID=A0ABY6B0F1_9BURK|nr:type II toxin-antitoxin system VapB family antitoxin [Roseateles amylovorans]UXH78422.1 type II toxin-antitoxin system VapB family antitoxin [Roseateles amylovorans]
MEMTIMIDEALYREALEVVGRPMPVDELVTTALRTFIRVEAGRRLAALGGTAPDMPDIPRRREAPDES